MSEGVTIEEDSFQFTVVEDADKPCTVHIIGRDAYGRAVNTKYVYPDTSSTGCDNNKASKLKQLEAIGTTIDKVIVTWG